MASTVNRAVALQAEQDEKVRGLIARGVNYSDFVQAATDILLSGELTKYGGLTPGESLRRALARAEDAEGMRSLLDDIHSAICYDGVGDIRINLNKISRDIEALFTRLEKSEGGAPRER